MHYTPSTIPKDAMEALRPAFDRSYTEHVETWIDRCKSGEAHLWRHNGYWAIGRLITALKNGERIYHQVASAGEFEPALVEEMKAWAKANGCVKLVAEVRPGMVRRTSGYVIKSVTAEMEI